MARVFSREAWFVSGWRFKDSAAIGLALYWSDRSNGRVVLAFEANLLFFGFTVEFWT